MQYHFQILLLIEGGMVDIDSINLVSQNIHVYHNIYLGEMQSKFLALNIHL